MNQPVEFHKPVLCKELQEFARRCCSGVFVDATIGHAGHAQLLANNLNDSDTFIGLDVDPQCLEIAEKKLQHLKCKVCLVRENFGNLGQVLQKLQIAKVDWILADLGVNSAHLDMPDRGFSFTHDGPLDMRMDQNLNTTAADIVNLTPEKELADLIWNFGEERFSRRIAKNIVRQRKTMTIERTQQLVELINQALGIRGTGRKSKIHPATRTFQALRIVVNDELGCLKKLLDVAPTILNENGCIAVISFHSLEDRIVKYDFRENKKLGRYEILTKKPIQASLDERRDNPRSRSAKLRVAKRIVLN